MTVFNFRTSPFNILSARNYLIASKTAFRFAPPIVPAT